jgi:hypothetical protein
MYYTLFSTTKVFFIYVAYTFIHHKRTQSSQSEASTLRFVNFVSFCGE